jgi:hypothetical protein
MAKYRSLFSPFVLYPCGARIASLTNRYFFAVALQGVMQIVTIIIMARFATGI